MPAGLPVSGLFLLCGSLLAQGAPPDDPYIGGQVEALAELGYVSPGPFSLGDGHGSQQVDELIGAGRLRWVETAHFRIGCGLAARPLPEDPATRRLLLTETRRLRQKHRGFPLTPRQLDQWLQLHLLAQRMEDLYADLLSRTGVTEAGIAIRRGGGVNSGPHLGCREKFVVLAFEAEGDLVRYLRRFLGCGEDRPWIQYFGGTDCFLFATAAEAFSGALRDPLTLHGHLVHGMTRNLMEAFCGVEQVPFWLHEGLAHWCARRVDPRIVDITSLPVDGGHRFEDGRWERRVFLRSRQDMLPALADLLTWCDGQGRDLTDHAALWSLIDCLLAQQPERVARFLQSCRTRPLTTRYLAPEEVLEWHEAVFQEAFGWDLAALDAAWKKHIATKYRKYGK